jgi:hypothetical protein
MESLLEKKAVPTWEDFMSGKLVYCLKVPEEANGKPRPLVLIKEFSRTSRPQAWKNCDVKLQATLPLPGNDEVGIGALSDGSKYVVAQVELFAERATQLS